MSRELPRILETLQTEANVRVHPRDSEKGFDLYLVDLTYLRLRFPDRTPFVVVKEQAVRENREQVWNAFVEIVRKHQWQYRLPLLVVEGSSDYLREQIALAQESQFTAAILDDAVADAMAAGNSSVLPMLDAVLAQIPRRELLPYETSAPVTGSRFFGRQSEVRRLIQPDASYAVTGPRRIGKTSLILEVRRKIEEKQHCIFMVCSTLRDQAEFIRELIGKLRPTELRHLDHHLYNFASFAQRMPKFVGDRLTLILDEIDRLVEIDAAQGYSILGALRDARNADPDGWRFIFAGATTLQHACTDNASPLYNMVRHMPLKPFSPRQARALIVQPFEAVRLTLRNKTELVSRIYRETGGHPNLIQHYCVLLADIVDQQGRDYIEVNDLGQVYTSRAFRNYVLRSFEVNTGPMEQLVVYSMTREAERSKTSVEEAQFTQREIDEALKAHKIRARFIEIDTACDNLEEVGVLRRVRRAYQFTLPLLPRLLREAYELDYLVDKAKEELRR